MRVETHLQEFHNQYLFSKDAKKIRDKLTCLYSIYIDYRQVNKVPQMDTKFLTRNICNKLGNPELYNDLLQIVEQPEALKVLFVFLLKGFSWNSELRERFNISKTFFVDKTVTTLLKHKLILKETGDSINLHYFEIIKRCNQDSFRRSFSKANFLFVTPDLIKIGFELLEYFEYLIKSSLTVGKSLQDTIKCTLIFIKQFDRIREEEESLMYRSHTTEDGIMYEIDTKKSLNFENEIKQASLEFKQERLLEKQKQQEKLSQSEINALTVVKNELQEIQNKSLSKIDSVIDSYKKTKRSLATLNGQSISASEFERIQKNNEDFDNEPTILGKPELCLEVPRTITGIPYTSLYLSNKGREFFGKKTEMQKAEDFINSLWSD